ncbi:hypothetical protein IGI04_024452 [Brassica rapa subsp. trilocularis]|uniref:C2H2-type domain-containing protein n=1 Tax=Brassica rapa subsp. trilocularis TaxID=1813537 RepID=A0ABQ7M6R7_BRACM|nr:hypothetical protein IGI04_024452 [Brassica rapa subsp. trilocularis]
MEILFENLKGRMKMKKRGSWYYSRKVIEILSDKVLAERELKIQSDVKEIRKVFCCELCSNQYRTVMESEGHLSSYDHNHNKRFKDMKEMLRESSRDDRKKREKQRQEREMTKMTDARKQQQIQQNKQEEDP